MQLNTLMIIGINKKSYVTMNIDKLLVQRGLK